MLRPYLRVIGMQVLGTLGAAIVALWFAGAQGLLSALLGGAVGAVGGLVFAFLVGRPRPADAPATEVIFRALRAEGIKLGLMGGLLWLILANYQGVVIVGFVGAFILSILIFQLALFVQVR